MFSVNDQLFWALATSIDGKPRILALLSDEYRIALLKAIVEKHCFGPIDGPYRMAVDIRRVEEAEFERLKSTSLPMDF